jgi:hypothetical protein
VPCSIDLITLKIGYNLGWRAFWLFGEAAITNCEKQQTKLMAEFWKTRGLKIGFVIFPPIILFGFGWAAL